MMRSVGYAFGVVCLAMPAVVGLTAGAGLGRCHLVAPTTDDCDAGVDPDICQTMTAWDYTAGTWTAPDGAVMGYSLTEDGAVWSSRSCAVGAVTS